MRYSNTTYSTMLTIKTETNIKKAKQNKVTAVD